MDDKEIAYTVLKNACDTYIHTLGTEGADESLPVCRYEIFEAAMEFIYDENIWREIERSA